MEQAAEMTAEERTEQAAVYTDRKPAEKRDGGWPDEAGRRSGLFIRPVARVQSDFPEKFGIPRQSGLAPSLIARVVLEPEFSDPEAVRGLEQFSHLWLIWEFSEVTRKGEERWSPTVRPPRLGGNERTGVFATRSPFRPNHLGLSCVELKKIEYAEHRKIILVVAGADLMDGTPVYDIKPYLPYVDCKPDATGGFTETARQHVLQVDFPEELRKILPADKVSAAVEILAQDPRPAYHTDPDRVYGISFAGFDIRFIVKESVLSVTDIVRR